MAVVSRFFGVLIIMLFRESAREAPHFHARHAEFNLQVGIDPVTVLAGKAPPRIQNMILRWAEHHREELMDRRRCRNREQPVQIEPWK
jgi:hypothetical protein